jgi:hypothetical protein
MQTYKTQLKKDEQAPSQKKEEMIYYDYMMHLHDNDELMYNRMVKAAENMAGNSEAVYRMKSGGFAFKDGPLAVIALTS